MILLNNSLIYITLSILLQCLVDVKSQAAIFKPDSRTTHTATLINNKLYILGGVASNDTQPKGAFFYLDVSVPFNTNELKWNDLSATTKNILPPNDYSAAVKGGANNDTLFLYGGQSVNAADKLSLVYTFDTQNNLCKI